MSKLSKESLSKMCDDIVGLAKQEMKKIDPRTKLPGTLISKGDIFHFDQQTTPSSAQLSGAVKQTFSSTAPTPTPTPQDSTKKSSEPLKKPVPEGMSPEKFDSCVDQVKDKSGKKVNAYAVCNASLKKDKHAGLVSKLSECFNKSGYSMKKDQSIQQGIAAAGGGGNAPINPGVASSLGGAFGKVENENNINKAHEHQSNYFDCRYKSKMVHYSKLNEKQKAQAKRMYPYQTPVSSGVGHNKPISNENYHYQLNAKGDVSGNRYLSQKGLHEGRLSNLKAQPKPNLPKSENIKLDKAELESFDAVAKNYFKNVGKNEQSGKKAIYGEASNDEKSIAANNNEIKKDDKPHPPGSPEERSHAVAEQGVSIPDAIRTMKNPSANNKKRLMDHLRQLADKSKRRSPSNVKAGVKKQGY